MGYDKYFEKDNIISLTIIPVSLNDGLFEYETGEVCNSYAHRTIADLNGMNNVTKPIENFSELVQFLKNQIP
jgi:hypothetical protein